MDDGNFRSGHDNFIYILWQNFHLTSLFFHDEYSSWTWRLLWYLDGLENGWSRSFLIKNYKSVSETTW